MSSAPSALHLPARRTCAFSRCRTYRYRLEIHWSDGPCINWLMLNPSTADEVANDPTVERCERRSRAWGYGRMIVTNLFGLRATDPAWLRKVEDPVGPRNNHHIIKAALEADQVMVAWGNHGRIGGRSAKVCRLLERKNLDLHTLRVSKTGEPAHPLYLSYDLTAIEYLRNPPAE
ncbi:MAG: DUF1643 domain-containing protein [Planctomycetaceae bacterium]|nr:DUF1643 domain-containing protein [Planctomycetaceae bacterium]